MDAIKIRRSIRKFKHDVVEDEKIEKMLRAGMQAPSAGNQQPWEFVIVRNSKLKDEISKMNPYAGSAKEAPAIIVVLANNNFMKFPENMQQDLGACTQNILLESVEQGLGSTWMSVYPQDERIACIRTTLDLPDHITPYAIVTVGYPLHNDDNKFIDRFDKSRLHYEQY